MIRHNRYIWLALHFPQLPLEVLADATDATRPLVVIEQQRLHVVSNIATRHGLRPGMSLANAYALCSNVLALERQPWREQQALLQLAHWGYGVAPDITLADANSLLLEIGSCRRLYGGLRPLLQRIWQELHRRGHQLTLGLAHTPKAAWLLAHTGQDVAAMLGNERLQAVALERQLGGVSVTSLPLEPKVLAALEQMGVATLAELAALPMVALGKRFGAPFVKYLQQLTGHLPDPQPPFRPAPEFEHALAFTEGVSDKQMLLFPMKRLVQSLCDYLVARQLHCRVLHWQFFDAHKLLGELHIELSQTQNRWRTFLELSQLKFEALPLPEPVFTLQLRCDQFIAAEAPCLDLFGDDLSLSNSSIETHATPVLLDKLSARLGNDALCRLTAREQHWPEAAWEQLPLHTRPLSTASPTGPRPLWLLPQPLPLQWRQDQLCWREPLTLVRGPERITGQWWQSSNEPRDYYVAALPDGSRCWVFRQVNSEQWFMHGWFA